MKKKLLALLFILINVHLYAQEWTRTYGGVTDDRGYSIAKTYDGGFIISGTATRTSKDIVLIKINSDGDTSWIKYYGGTYSDESFCVKECLDSGFIIAGNKSNASAHYANSILSSRLIVK